MPSGFSSQLKSSLGAWWRSHVRANGAFGAASLLARELWGFLRDSTPERRRQRYGDMEYDWEQRVNTTSGAVGWHTRLLGIFHSPYQPVDPREFREIMREVMAALAIDFREFTFIDIGSGKGRALLLASEYPFRKIIGVELLPELHLAAEENIAAFRGREADGAGESEGLGETEKSRQAVDQEAPIESICLDACQFQFPATPLIVYLFNPLPEAQLRQVMLNLVESAKAMPRPVWIVYHNPLLEDVLRQSAGIGKIMGTVQFSLFRVLSENAS